MLTFRRLFSSNVDHIREEWHQWMPRQPGLRRVCCALHLAFIVPLLPSRWAYLRLTRMA